MFKMIVNVLFISLSIASMICVIYLVSTRDELKYQPVEKVTENESQIQHNSFTPKLINGYSI